MMAPAINAAAPPVLHYRTARVAGLDIFFREAGPVDAPALLLLHGFPTSSHMFRDLIPLLADRYRLVAPDYPGFGYSSAPAVKDFDYTFDHLADVMQQFTDVVGLASYALYAQDFGGPVGFRLAARRPDRIRALIIQNANIEIHMLNAGHFALETHAAEIARRIGIFLAAHGS
jgi:pimeloyl-ACP methyl ester carboxylesterase